jgi:tyrosine-protein kinase
MKPSAAEALKAAIRRAIPLTIVLIVLGIGAMNTLKQLQGPRYSAGAKVALATVDLGAMLSGTDPGFVDPERQVQTALDLARSRETYRRAAAQIPGTELSGTELRSMTTVTGQEESDIIGFTTTAEERQEAITVVNTVAEAFVDWRADIAAGTIRTAIQQVRARLRNPAAPRTVLRQQLEQLRTLETLNSGQATVIEPATRASQVSPSPVRDSLLGGAVGLVVAFLVAAAREALNTRVRSEADVEDMLGRPVLGTIHTLPRRARVVTLGRHSTRFGDTYGLLAANLMQIKGGDPDRKVLAVTSAIAGEGKTTTASNLAVALALRGHRVLLADFDLRKPSLGQFFRIPVDSPGVLQLVNGEVDFGSTVWSVPLNGAGPSGSATPPGRWSDNGARRVPGEAGWLRVVPSGGVRSSARAARSVRIPLLFETLRREADIVVVDTPPALATVEMAELNPHLDFVLVCVRHGRVTRRSLQALSRQAENWRPEIVGAVLTDSPPEADDRYYYQST